MLADDDRTDLQAFARTRDEAALSRLVHRHADFVYSTCLRQVRDPSLAEDAAQAVFILLARNAPRLASGNSVVGWLFNVARYTSLNTLRSERRRRKHEKEAAVRADAVVHPVTSLDGPLDPHLDAALARLSGKDRQALFLRFFQDQTHEQIGLSMGTTAHAAKMRVLRALDKLRAQLNSEGLALAPATLEASLLACASSTAPIGFAETASRAARGAGACAGAVAIASATGAMMTLRRVAVIVTLALATPLAAAGAAIALQRNAPRDTALAAAPAVAPATPTSQSSPIPFWRTEFDSVYTLDDGEAIRRIPPPYIEARKGFLQDNYHPIPSAEPGGNGVVGSRSTGNTTDPPDAMYLEWDPVTHRVEKIRRLNWGYWRFESLTVNLIGLRPEQFSMPTSLMDRELPGDWVMRKGATPEQKLASFAKTLEKTPAAFRFEKKTLPRDVVVMKGTFAPDEWPKRTITLTFNAQYIGKGATQGGDVGYFIRAMSRKLLRPVVNEWKGSDAVRIEFPALDFKLRNLPKDEQDKRVRELIASMADQMHIEFVPEQREIETFFIEPSKPAAE
jgi:RNA polymerase sigma factor (sigma-70 family)